ncbi:MAG TPA: DoxX family protein [Thermoanaerobaculia bacterium]|nr:DoxX family protein [Thermoanaerobaculia bacterium]
MRRFFAVPEHSTSGDVALLLLRLVAGFAFALHGWPKIQNAFGWMGPEAFAPGPLQALAALSEFGGGIAWALGLLTPLASLGIACTMAVAFYLHAVMMGDPFVASGPGQGAYELALLYLAIAILLFVMGPGRFSVDRALFGRK